MVNYQLTATINSDREIRVFNALIRAAKLMLSGLFIGSIMIGFIVFASATLPTLLGYTTMVISSGSMDPAIGVGDAVVIRPEVATSSIRVGDVITYRPFGLEGTTTHRVQAIKEVQERTFFQTKGDANGATDPALVDAKAVYGKVTWTLPKVGYLLYFAGGRWGKLLVFGAPALLLAFWEIRKLLDKSRISGANGRKSDEVESRAVALSS